VKRVRKKITGVGRREKGSGKNMAKERERKREGKILGEKGAEKEKCGRGRKRTTKRGWKERSNKGKKRGGGRGKKEMRE